MPGDAHHRCWHKSKTCTAPLPADVTPPDPTLESDTPETITSDSPAFSFTSSERPSTFECRLDVLEWTACSSPTGYSGLWNQVHTFEVRAKDAAGNVDPTPARYSFTVQVPAPVPVPVPSTGVPITEWGGVGAAPLSDGEAASRVRPVAENRPGNADENAYRPSAAELDSFRNGQVDRYGRTQMQYNPLAAHVTGGFSGSTDEILQWAAHKWGIPEDVVRAVATNESYWSMSQLGDRKTVSDPSRYPAQSRIPGTSDVYESLGIMQVRWTPEGLHQGTESLRWKSTAFNVDYWASVVRYYYDGLCSWCGAGYSAGQEWASVGAWYNPSPWISASAAYVERAKTHLANPPGPSRASRSRLTASRSRRHRPRGGQSSSPGPDRRRRRSRCRRSSPSAGSRSMAPPRWSPRRCLHRHPVPHCALSLQTGGAEIVRRASVPTDPGGAQ